MSFFLNRSKIDYTLTRFKKEFKTLEKQYLLGYRSFDQFEQIIKIYFKHLLPFLKSEYAGNLIMKVEMELLILDFHTAIKHNQKQNILNRNYSGIFRILEFFLMQNFVSLSKDVEARFPEIRFIDEDTGELVTFSSWHNLIYDRNTYYDRELPIAMEKRGMAIACQITDNVFNPKILPMNDYFLNLDFDQTVVNAMKFINAYEVVMQVNSKLIVELNK